MDSKFANSISEQHNRRTFGIGIISTIGSAIGSYYAAQANEKDKQRKSKRLRHLKRRELLTENKKVELFVINYFSNRIEPKDILDDINFLGFGPIDPFCTNYLVSNKFPNRLEKMMGKKWNPSFSYWKNISKKKNKNFRIWD